MTEGKIPVWLDCDPGHDDAFAMLLAAEHPSLQLLGISTVHGNAPLDRVTENAVRVLTAIGRTEIPVYSGSRKPFMRPAVHAPAIHGESGIDGTDLLPDPEFSHERGNAIQAIYEAIMKTPFQTCVIVATGTLTNVALLFAIFPDVAGHIKELSIMGGSFMEGNITKFAEFNIYCDPESANSIFSNPTLSNRITLIPLDLTHQVRAIPSVLQRLLSTQGHITTAAASSIEANGTSLKSTTTPFRKMLHDLLIFFAGTYASVFDINDGPPLHDPLAVAAIIPRSSSALLLSSADPLNPTYPEIAWTFEHCIVTVDIHGPELGKTRKAPPTSTTTTTNSSSLPSSTAIPMAIAEDGAELPQTEGMHLGHHHSKAETIVRVAVGVDVEKFWEVLLDAVSVADERRRVKWKN